MNKPAATFTVLLSLFISGCSNNTPYKAQDLSTSGIAYVDTVDGLLDETIRQVIDFDSRELLKTRNGSHPRRMLKEKNKSLTALIKEINHFRYQNLLMKNYFTSLQALADAAVVNDGTSIAEGIGSNVGEISGTIQYLNNRPRDENDTARIDKHLSLEEEGYIAKLTGLLVKSHYAARIEKALQRDAPIIGKQLLLQEKQLNHILAILKDRIAAGSTIHLTDKVMTPYIDKETPIPDEETWILHRHEWFEMQQVDPIFKNVRDAHQELRSAWEYILQGQQDIGSVSIMLEDVNEFVATLHELDESRNRKTETTDATY